MDYIGEHLLPGQIGHFLIILSLVSSGIATFAYFKSMRQPAMAGQPDYWKRLARGAFIVESLSVFAIFGILIYLISNHYFEYKYVWQHSSKSLEFKYLLAAIWEGQEGSFLLWSIWHCALGLVMIRTAGKWESPAMGVVSLVQFFLATMIAGIYIFGWKMGSNPFVLLRDSGVLDNAPALHMNLDVTQPLKPDYLASIQDGNDLNPLLQNYWMVIHPPVLFLGFAATVVPFAFAVGGLLKRDHGDWTKQALPWSLFGLAVLGVGIMMGGIWAYESLSFGGYWAWDPVENASLVPWMILVAGVHTLVIFKHTGFSLRSTYLFLILTFGFILYSTFLTRTGVLGETSVHAFTGEGSNLFYHLLFFMAVTLVPPIWLLIREYKHIPGAREEEKASSREFWMFIGALVFFLSAMLIIGKTSLPVFNLIFGTKTAPPEDAEFAYNSIQIYVAIIVAVLTAFSQYLRYKNTPTSLFWKKMLWPGVLSLVASVAFLLLGEINYHKKGPVFNGSLWLGVFASLYALIANAAYIWVGLKGRLSVSGGSVSHVGFALVLLGILISSSNKEVLTNNRNGIPVPVSEGENPMENLTLVEGVTMDMGKYNLTYLGDSAHPKKSLWFYKIRFQRKDGKEDFVLTPNSFVNYKGNEGLMSNPDARHYLDHDIFTYITSISNPDKSKDTSRFIPYSVKPGDTVFYSSGFLVVQELKEKADVPEELFGKDGRLYEAPLKVFSRNGTSYTLTARMALAKGERVAIPDTVTSENLVIQLQDVKSPVAMELGVKESDFIMKYVTIKAYKFPMIGLLWGGVVITAVGIFISMVRRIRLNRLKEKTL